LVEFADLEGREYAMAVLMPDEVLQCCHCIMSCRWRVDAKKCPGKETPAVSNDRSHDSAGSAHHWKNAQPLQCNLLRIFSRQP
jgi:hypothetical protein